MPSRSEQVLAGRDDVNVVRSDRRPVGGRLDGHGRVAGEYLREVALAGGVEVVMTTKVRPLSTGMAAKNFCSASRPPAEAPIPTTAQAGLSPGDVSVWSTLPGGHHPPFE